MESNFFPRTKAQINEKSRKIWQNGKGSNALNFCCTKSKSNKPNPIWYTKFRFGMTYSNFSLTLFEKPVGLTKQKLLQQA